MKKNLTFALLAAFTLALLTGCNETENKTTEKNVEKVENKKTSLVVYYSQTSTTQKVAQIFASSVGADMDSIVAAVPYAGSYEETIERTKQEFAKGEVPEVLALTKNVADYDTIYLGTPIWFGTVAQPMAGYLKKADLSNKVVVPFFTFGSGGLENGSSVMRKAAPAAKFLQGYGIRSARAAHAEEEVTEFLIRSGIKAGQVEELAAFSEQQPVADADIAIFNAACEGYPFPLGTPVTVGSRKVKAGTEYLFNVNSKNAEGKDVSGKVYIIVYSDANAKPEFTRVVR